mgnify:CR=1 FL=1
MSQIDTVFQSIPAPLLNDWGQTITYIKSSTPRNYNPTTGVVNGADVSVTVKGVITRVTPRESEGLYQTTDLKVIIGTTQDGATREAKIIAITSYRGDNPVLHTLIARPQ